MAEHGALATLKDLAEKEVEDAARLLGEMRRGCQQAEEQLKMLIDYQNEYRNNLNSDMSAGGNDSNLLIVFYVQIMPDDFVMQLHR
ncbi:flagellar FliJ family protein, partial [Escherichia coli]